MRRGLLAMSVALMALMSVLAGCEDDRCQDAAAPCLTVPAAGVARVEGTVTDSTGKPVANADVTFLCRTRPLAPSAPMSVKMADSRPSNAEGEYVAWMALDTSAAGSHAEWSPEGTLALSCKAWVSLLRDGAEFHRDVVPDTATVTFVPERAAVSPGRVNLRIVR